MPLYKIVQRPEASWQSPPARMLKLLSLEEDHAYGLIVWAALLAPIALMWIIGGIAFGTAGWLARGFKARRA